jgi:hypothetical protein
MRLTMPRGEGIEHFGKLAPVGLRARHLAVNLAATGGAQLHKLRVLAVGTDAGIAEMAVLRPISVISCGNRNLLIGGHANLPKVL